MLFTYRNGVEGGVGCDHPFSLALYIGYIMSIMFHFQICFKNPKRFVFVSSRYLICSFIAISHTFFLQLQNENLLKSLKQ